MQENIKLRFDVPTYLSHSTCSSVGPVDRFHVSSRDGSPVRPVYSCDLGVFCTPKFSAYEN